MTLAMEPTMAGATPSMIPLAASQITPEARAAADRVLQSGRITGGREVEAFEAELGAWVGAGEAIAVRSCTDALVLSLEALHLPEGTGVICPALTSGSSIQAILQAGLRPVLADVDPTTLMPDPARTAAAAHRSGGVGALLVVHFAGHPAAVAELALAAGVPLTQVVEDAAHALGAGIDGRRVGSSSTVTCFSFHATENLPIGEGGMITTDQEELARRIRRGRQHGINGDGGARAIDGGWHYQADGVGHGSTLTDVEAAIGRAHLHRVDEWQQRRELLARRYDRNLAGVSGLSGPKAPESARHAWHLYVTRVGPEFGIERDALIAELAACGIESSVPYRPVHQLDQLRAAIDPLPPLPDTEAVADQILSLPLHPGLDYDAVDRVCEAMLTVHRASRPARANGNGHARLRQTAVDGPAPSGLRTLIVGAGAAGRSIARDLDGAPSMGLNPIGFVDDDPGAGTVNGLPVVGGIDGLANLVGKHDADMVIVAIPSLPQPEVRRIMNDALAGGAAVRFLPSFVAVLERDARLDDLHHLDLDELLGRKSPPVVRAASRAVVAGRRVLVTGAGGSIGSEVCRQVDRFGPSAMYLLDHDESNLHRLQLQLEGAALLQSQALIIADIRDRRRMHQVFAQVRPDIVFHTAAHKHLPLLEQHPCEGVKSNVAGTQNLLDAARANGVGTFVNVSTDKAADPTSVLGATKRLAEMLTSASAGGDMRVASVRFGNVLGSRGSFLSVLADQITHDEPITITDPEVSRFFMTVEEAVGLVIEAAGLADDGQIFVLDMGEPVRLVDLVTKYATQLHLDPTALNIRFTGLRPGEKLHEALFAGAESCEPTAHHRIWATTSPSVDGLRLGLEALYGAAAENRGSEVRRCLASLLPDYTYVDDPPPAVLAAPYPDDF